ncbi:Trihelix transcription factor GTL1-like protein [Rhynchospora pubera]|uniref:Trihelix transcription factor GTL1-like protein n=1 Tax=Rhynchospora pubera TaxID=906938 RepID=A0AAV8G5L8_9POAL|nr:Trihelix transcription factor GTL1-like protein [Rhynchospora pubera]
MENGKEASVSPPPPGPQPRMPRWNRREILALVRAKREVEDGGGSPSGGRGRRPASSPEGGHVALPKWNAVSEGCRVRAVHRGPTQCRKRWTNLIAAYRKIQNWERGRGKKEEKGDDVVDPAHVDREQKGFWEMGGEERKEKGLPARFDRVVYEIMGGKDVADVVDQVYDEGDEVVMDSEEEEEEVKGGPPALSPGPAISVIPISMRRFQPSCEGSPDPEWGSEKQPNGTQEQTSPKKEGSKRKRSKDLDAEEVQPEHFKLIKRLTETMERGTRLVAAQLEAQTIQLQIDRNQRKEQFDELLKAFNRLADGITKIAEKL